MEFGSENQRIALSRQRAPILRSKQHVRRISRVGERSAERKRALLLPLNHPDASVFDRRSELATLQSTHMHAATPKIVFQFWYPNHTEVEYRCREQDSGTGLDGLTKVLQFAGASGGDYLR